MRLLENNRVKNKLYRKVIWGITNYTNINYQISFWRMRDMKDKVKPMTAIKMVKLKKMGELLFKAYIRVIARCFWRIDRFNETGVSMNSSAIMDRKREMGWKTPRSQSPSLANMGFGGFNLKQGSEDKNKERSLSSNTLTIPKIVYDVPKTVPNSIQQSPAKNKVSRSNVPSVKEISGGVIKFEDDFLVDNTDPLMVKKVNIKQTASSINIQNKNDNSSIKQSKSSKSI